MPDTAVCLTLTQLDRLLRLTKRAHSTYEHTHGPDPDWPAWYARFMFESARTGISYVDTPFDR